MNASGYLSSVCVFCGSNPGIDPAFAEGAVAFGALLARRGLRLVYGGGHVGLMGAVADGALAEGGEVLGVITRSLESREVAHQGLSDLRVVETMHERKALMADLSDAFVMLPGGFGTWDEFFEAVTWTQLGIHSKPCGILEIGDYFAPLAAMLGRAAAAGFVRPEHRAMVIVELNPDALLDRLRDWEPVRVDKRLGRSSR